MKRINILGTEVNLITKGELIKKCEDALKGGKNLKLFAINPIKVSKGYFKEELRNILNKGDINFCDGKGLCYGIKILCGEKIERIAGFEFLFEILNLANKMKKSVFFIGNREESIKKGVEILKREYPDVNFMGYLNGYFKKEEIDYLVQKFKNNPPDILFVGMGAFLQERWILYVLDRVGIKLSMGIGGSVDVISGFSPRAPEFICNMGLEWFYRLIKQPKRIKVMIHLPIFLFLLFKEKFFGGNKKC